MPAPFSPVHRLRKFSAVFGVTSERSVISIRPHGASPMTTSKKTMGLPMSRDADVGIVAYGVRTSFSRWVVAIDGGVKDEESFPTEEFPCTRALTRAKIYRQFVLATVLPWSLVHPGKSIFSSTAFGESRGFKNLVALAGSASFPTQARALVEGAPLVVRESASPRRQVTRLYVRLRSLQGGETSAFR